MIGIGVHFHNTDVLVFDTFVFIVTETHGIWQANGCELLHKGGIVGSADG